MRFSVVVPLYNKAPYVAKAIGSILSQTFTDYELVIMDDGSTDDSYENALKVIQGRGNCHIYRQKNAGVSMARNIGVALSQGDYVCFLDADDWWDPAFLEEMNRLIVEFPEAGIYGTSYTIVNETKRKTRIAMIGVDEGFVKGYVNYCQVYAKTMYMPLTSISVAVPRQVFDEMEGFPRNIKLGEDFMLWIRIALKYRVAFLNKPLAYYNQDVNVANRAVGRLHKPEENMLWNVGFLEEEEHSNADYKQLIDNLRINNLLTYYLSKNYHDAALKELKKVDWSRQTKDNIKQFAKPLCILKTENAIMRALSRIKTYLMSL